MKRSLFASMFFLTAFVWGGSDTTQEEINVVNENFSRLSKDLTSQKDFSPVIKKIRKFIENAKKIPYEQRRMFEAKLLDLQQKYALLCALKNYLREPLKVSTDTFKKLKIWAQCKDKATADIIDRTEEVWKKLSSKGVPLRGETDEEAIGVCERN